jgi:hypothetical protein
MGGARARERGRGRARAREKSLDRPSLSHEYNKPFPPLSLLNLEQDVHHTRPLHTSRQKIPCTIRMLLKESHVTSHGQLSLRALHALLLLFGLYVRRVVERRKTVYRWISVIPLSPSLPLSSFSPTHPLPLPRSVCSAWGLMLCSLCTSMQGLKASTGVTAPKTGSPKPAAGMSDAGLHGPRNVGCRSARAQRSLRSMVAALVVMLSSFAYSRRQACGGQLP